MTPDASWHETDLVHAPDARRKKLLQKLAGQMGRGVGVPMPGHLGAFGAEGRPFQSAGAGRLPRSHATNPSNVLASVLARLGMAGAPGMGSEVGSGAGHAIDSLPPRPPGIPPSIAPPIPTPNAPAPPVVPITAAGGSSGGIPADGGFPASPQDAPGTSGGFSLDPRVATGGIPPTSGGGGGYVPLGGGLYYDPMTDTVIGSGSSAGGAARRL